MGARLLITSLERRRLQSSQLEVPLEHRNVQRNQIDRVTGATAETLLFVDSRTFFRPGSGLWCLLRGEEADLEGLVLPALWYLADTGLGADRSVGVGQFDIHVEDAPPLPDAGEEANAMVMLSRYLPADDEWRLGEGPIRYELVHLWARRESRFVETVPQRVSPPVYKRLVRIFAPGSVFPLKQRREIYGRLAKVVEDGDGPWPIWQSGLALAVFAKMPQA